MQARASRGELPAPVDGDLRAPLVVIVPNDWGAAERCPPDNFFLGLVVGMMVSGGMAAVLACLWAIRPW